MESLSTEITQIKQNTTNSEKFLSTDFSKSLSVDIGANQEFKPTWRFYLAYLSLSVITLAAALDATSIGAALPIIAEKLNGTAIEAFWSGTSFLLTSTVFQPSYASLSHIFGRKPLVYAALILFAVGAINAALAKNFTVLLIGRCIQGAGSGGIVSMTQVITTDLVLLAERGRWYGFITGMWAIGSVSGPVIGGAFSQRASWTWIFWLNLPIVGVGSVMVTLFLKLKNIKAASFVEQLKRIDWVGTVLFIASVISLLGGVIYPWSSWRTLVPLLLGFPTEPVVRFSIFSTWTSRIIYFQTFAQALILWSILYYSPFYFEAVKGYTPILAGVALFPETFTVAPISVLIGILVTIIGKYKWAIWSDWAVTVLGMGLLYLQDVHTHIVAWIFLHLVPGTGTGIVYAALAIAVPTTAQPKDMAHAVAFYSFFRTFGQGVGVAINGSIFQNQMAKNLRKYPLLEPLADQFIKDAAGLVQIIKDMQEGLDKTQLIQAYANSLKIVWICMCEIAGLALVSCFWVKEMSLQRENVTEQGLVDGK